MTLKTVLVGLSISEDDLLLGLRAGASEEGQLDRSMTQAVRDLIPEANEGRVNSIIKVLKAGEYVTNVNGRGSNPKWMLHLDKFPPAPEAAPVLSLADTLQAMADQSSARAAEDTRQAQQYQDAITLLDVFDGDAERALRAAEIVRENLA